MNPNGRPKGSKNKNKLDVQARLDALGCDPITGLATLAMDPANTKELQYHCYKELLSYIAPKKKSVEVTGDEEAPVMVVYKWEGDEDQEQEKTDD